jgi:hypothetical protein
MRAAVLAGLFTLGLVAGGGLAAAGQEKEKKEKKEKEFRPLKKEKVKEFLFDEEVSIGISVDKGKTLPVSKQAVKAVRFSEPVKGKDAKFFWLDQKSAGGVTPGAGSEVTDSDGFIYVLVADAVPVDGVYRARVESKQAKR